MEKANIKKVVLAYSGGLDTSIIIPWLKENYNNCEVIAVSGNVGQGSGELDGLEEKAIKTGASKLYIEDLTAEFLTEVGFEAVKAGAKYEGDYLLGTAIARPIIAKRLVEIPRVPMPSATDARARATTKCASNSPSSRLRPICRLSPRGASGTSSRVRRKSSMPRHIIFR